MLVRHYVTSGGPYPGGYRLPEHETGRTGTGQTVHNRERGVAFRESRGSDPTINYLRWGHTTRGSE